MVSQEPGDRGHYKAERVEQKEGDDFESAELAERNAIIDAIGHARCMGLIQDLPRNIFLRGKEVTTESVITETRWPGQRV